MLIFLSFSVDYVHIEMYDLVKKSQKQKTKVLKHDRG